MIDIQIVKQKILEIAFHGGFEAIDYTSADANSLYEKILKNNDLIEIESVHLYEIPSNWKWISLGQVGIWGAGATPSRKIKEYYGGNIPWLKTGDLNDGVIEAVPEFITEKALKETSVKLNSLGAVLIAMYGATIGKLGILNIEATTNQACCACNVYKEIYNKFLFYYLMSQRENLKNMGSGGAQSNISKEKIIGYSFPLAPYEEQVHIVDKIEKMFRLLNKINDLQEKYTSDEKILKDKIIDAGIQGKLTEQLPEDGTAEELYSLMIEEKKQILKDRKGREDKNIKDVDIDVPYELPDNWKWVRFGEIGLFKKGPFGSALTKSMFVPKSDDTVKVYEQQHAIQKNSELGTYYITREYFDDRMSGFEVLPGDILVSCAGTIGETYILPDEIEQGIINQALMRVSLVPSVNKRFFQYYFDANLKKTAQEESNGSAIKNIPPFDVMKNWYFPLAPLKEQERIVEKIEELLALI